MKNNEMKCPNCAGTLQLSSDKTKKICPYCDAEFVIQVHSNTPEKTMKVNDNKPIPRQDPASFINSICANSGFDSVYGAVGLSLIGTNKYNKAKKHFKFLDGEDAYLIFDATVLGSCKKGFAVCTTGFYYSADGENAYVISWDDFKNVNIYKEKGKLRINGKEFLTGNDGEKLYTILTDIQRWL